MTAELTERQTRELEYHRSHAAKHLTVLDEPVPYEILTGRRWWNQYWEMYFELRRIGVSGKRVLVVGCGFGVDAVMIARMGAGVYAFDLSPESLDIAKKLAARESAKIDFRELAAESLDYPSAFFDVVMARDILHHVDISRTLAELKRVTKPRGVALINEIYSHSWTDRVRHSWFVEHLIYDRMKRVIYGDTVYITEDERKLTERDIAAIHKVIRFERRRYFNLFVMRLVSGNLKRVSQFDQLLLGALGPIGSLVAGRVMIEGRFR